MAESKVEVRVAVDAAIHSAFASLAQNIMAEYGIVVSEARFDWAMTQRMCDERATGLVTKVSLASSRDLA